MTTQELIEWVQYRLGYPVLNVEVPESTIASCIDDALDEVVPWYNKPEFITVYLGDSKCIDLSKYHISEVINVYPADEVMYNSNEFFPNQSSMTNVINNRLENMLIHQTLGYVKDNISFMFQGDKLYVDVGYPISKNITIEYLPKILSVEDITDQACLRFVKDFSLAFTREVLGEIRGKFRLSNNPVELDYDHQYDKSNTELERLRQAIRDEYIDLTLLD